MADPIVKVPTYPVDMTGELASNLVTERVTLTTKNRDEFNIILPRCAPFFHDSVQIKKLDTEEVMTFGKDFYIGGIFEGITPYTKYNQQVGSIIVLLDQWVAGNYEIKYQTVGGDFILNETQFTQALKNAILNPLMVRWEDIHEKPIDFTPIKHYHPTDETNEYDDFINELGRVRQALEKFLGEERKGTPSYNQMLLLLLEHGRILAGLTGRINDLQTEITQSTAGAIARALEKANEVAKMAEQLTSNLSAAVDDRVEKLRVQVNDKIDVNLKKLYAADEALKQQITTTTNALKDELTNVVNVKLADHLAKITKNTEDIEKNKRDINTDLANNVANLTRTINQNKTDLTNLVNALANRAVVKNGQAAQVIQGTLEATKFISEAFGKLNTRTLYTDNGTSSNIDNKVNDKTILKITPDGTDNYGRFRFGGIDNKFASLYHDGHDNVLLTDTNNPINLKARDFIIDDTKKLSDAVFLSGNQAMRGPLYLQTADLLNVPVTDPRFNASGFRRPNGTPENGVGHGELEIAVMHSGALSRPAGQARAYGRTIGFNYGPSLGLVTGSYDAQGRNFRTTDILTREWMTGDKANNSADKIPTTQMAQELVSAKIAEAKVNPTLTGITYIRSPGNNSWNVPLILMADDPNPRSVEMWMGLRGVGGDTRASAKIIIMPDRTNNTVIRMHGVVDGNDNASFMELYKDRVWMRPYGNLHDYFVRRSELGDLNGYVKTSRLNDWTSAAGLANRIPHTHGNGHIYLGYRVHIRPNVDYRGSGADQVAYYDWNWDGNHGGAGHYFSGFVLAHHVGVRSDIRSKEDLKLIDSPFEKLSAINGYTYKMKKDLKGRRAGVIAQEVEKVLPEVVSEDTNDNETLKSVDYNGLVALLIEAVKELKTEVVSLREELDQYKEGKQ